jgi:hypothetical protein
VQQTEEYYSSAGSEPVPGAARSPLEEVSTQELMLLPPGPMRPRWMRTRFPVDMEERWPSIPRPRTKTWKRRRRWRCCEWGTDGLGKYFSLCTAHSSAPHTQKGNIETRPKRPRDPDLSGESTGSGRKGKV